MISLANGHSPASCGVPTIDCNSENVSPNLPPPPPRRNVVRDVAAATTSTTAKPFVLRPTPGATEGQEEKYQDFFRWGSSSFATPYRPLSSASTCGGGVCHQQLPPPPPQSASPFAWPSYFAAPPGVAPTMNVSMAPPMDRRQSQERCRAAVPYSSSGQRFGTHKHPSADMTSNFLHARDRPCRFYPAASATKMAKKPSQKTHWSAVRDADERRTNDDSQEVSRGRPLQYRPDVGKASVEKGQRRSTGSASDASTRPARSSSGSANEREEDMLQTSLRTKVDTLKNNKAAIMVEQEWKQPSRVTSASQETGRSTSCKHPPFSARPFPSLYLYDSAIYSIRRKNSVDHEICVDRKCTRSSSANGVSGSKEEEAKEEEAKEEMVVTMQRYPCRSRSPWLGPLRSKSQDNTAFAAERKEDCPLAEGEPRFANLSGRPAPKLLWTGLSDRVQRSTNLLATRSASIAQHMKQPRSRRLPKDVRCDTINQFKKTKMCPFKDAEGGCRRYQWACCPFAHSEEEKRPLPDLTKTAMCKLAAKGFCPKSSEECSFAHSLGELRCTGDFFKTGMCRYWAEGRCNAGNSCRHAHGDWDRRPLRRYDWEPSARIPGEPRRRFEGTLPSGLSSSNKLNSRIGVLADTNPPSQNDRGITGCRISISDSRSASSGSVLRSNKKRSLRSTSLPTRLAHFAPLNVSVEVSRHTRLPTEPCRRGMSRFAWMNQTKGSLSHNLSGGVNLTLARDASRGDASCRSVSQSVQRQAAMRSGTDLWSLGKVQKSLNDTRQSRGATHVIPLPESTDHHTFLDLIGTSYESTTVKESDSCAASSLSSDTEVLSPGLLCEQVEQCGVYHESIRGHVAEILQQTAQQHTVDYMRKPRRTAGARGSLVVSAGPPETSRRAPSAAMGAAASTLHAANSPASMCIMRRIIETCPSTKLLTQSPLQQPCHLKLQQDSCYFSRGGFPINGSEGSTLEQRQSINGVRPVGGDSANDVSHFSMSHQQCHMRQADMCLPYDCPPMAAPYFASGLEDDGYAIHSFSPPRRNEAPVSQLEIQPPSFEPHVLSADAAERNGFATNSVLPFGGAPNGMSSDTSQISMVGGDGFIGHSPPPPPDCGVVTNIGTGQSGNATPLSNTSTASSAPPSTMYPPVYVVAFPNPVVGAAPVYPTTPCAASCNPHHLGMLHDLSQTSSFHPNYAPFTPAYFYPTYGGISAKWPSYGDLPAPANPSDSSFVALNGSADYGGTTAYLPQQMCLPMNLCPPDEVSAATGLRGSPDHWSEPVGRQFRAIGH